VSRQKQPEPVHKSIGYKFISDDLRESINISVCADLIDQMPLPAVAAISMKANVAVITTLSDQITHLEKRLQENVEDRLEYAPTYQHSGYWSGNGDKDPARNGTD